MTNDLYMKKQHIVSEFSGGKISGYNYGPYPDHHYKDFRYVGLKNLLFPIQVLAVGDDYWHRECLRERTNSNIFSMEYVVEGIFQFTQNNQTYDVHPGELFLVQPDVSDAMRCLTMKAVKKAVLMTGPLLRSTLEIIGLSKTDYLIPSAPQSILQLYQTLDELSEMKSYGNYRAACGVCYQLLLELTAQTQAMERPPELQQALEYIHDNLTGNLTLKQLSTHTGLSSATLNRHFQKYLNSSPIDYFLNQKLEHATTLLSSHVFSVKEVAAMLNYSSPQYFATEFKRKFGMPPSRF